MSAHGFNSSYFPELAKLEGKNFWFQSRNKLIIWALTHYAKNFSSLLEIGCGTGFVLSAIAKTNPNSKLIGTDLFAEGLDFASKRVPTAKFTQMDATQIPYENEFDVIAAFDSLEHIQDDLGTLHQMHRALKPSGYIFITVPQHTWLWSLADVYACHVRRYSSKELHQKIEDSGFKIIRSSSFVTLLLPLMLVSRLTNKIKTPAEFDPLSELRLNPILNFILKSILDLEIWILKLGINFRVGGSRIVVAQKN